MNLMKDYDPDISIKELFHNPAKINVRFSRNFSCITGSSHPRISSHPDILYMQYDSYS